MLMGQRSNSIALVIPELKNPFFAVVADGVQAVARAREALVWMVASNNDVEVEQREIQKLLSYNVDGIVLISSDPRHRYLKGLIDNDTPVIAIDLPIESASTDSVLVENRQGAQQAVEHLINHGYKNILCLGAWPGLYTIRERIAGYESAMRNAGLPSKVLTDACDLASTRQAIERLIQGKRPRGAIFSLNQLTTEIILKLLDEMQITIPDQIALIGFDDFSFASLLKPGLTVVRQPAGELGQCATRMLFERLDAKDNLLKRRMLLPTELVIRESCGCKGEVSSKPSDRSAVRSVAKAPKGNYTRRK
jgi:LacI family transcriptional regulator